MESFSSLEDPIKKVEAVLAGVREPCPQEFILELAGIPSGELTAAQSEQIDALLLQYKADAPVGTHSTWPAEVPLFWIPPEQRTDAAARIGVDMLSVRRHIAALGRKKLGVE